MAVIGLTFASIVQRQLQLLQHVSETLMARALAGSRVELDNFFATQDRLEHWLQYLSPIPLDTMDSTLDAPPPLPQMRPAPPLPHEEEIYGRARETMERQQALDSMDEALRPRVSFPPEPLWVDDLEREQGEREG